MSNNKAQKGWLSRWTRKQWSRHWFVLRNGSLTYYRGPAAELCSFLDGVLDLSLIKHIEVQQDETSQANHNGQHNHLNLNQNHQLHHLSHHHHIGGHQNAGNQNTSSQNSQFTFSLKMWNGECHLLGASSAAERSLWLEAINACTNGEADDDAATDSASSSDSSPTSNLSARSTDIGRMALSRYQANQRQPVGPAEQQQQQQLDQCAANLKSLARREKDVLLELKVASNNQDSKSVGRNEAVILERRQQALSRHSPLQVANLGARGHHGAEITRRHTIQDAQSAPMSNQYLVNNMVTCSSQAKISDRQQQRQQPSSQQQDDNRHGDNFQNNNLENRQQQDENQAFKRRLMCVQARLNSNESSNEPKLITRQAKRTQDLLGNIFLRRAAQLQAGKTSLNVASSDEDDQDDDEDDESSSLSSDSETTTSIVDEDDEAAQLDTQRPAEVEDRLARLSPEEPDNARSADCVMLVESDQQVEESAESPSEQPASEALNGIIKTSDEHSGEPADGLAPSNGSSLKLDQQQQKAKQKKRVTFDLSPCLHQHSSGSGSDSSSDCSLSSSSSAGSSSEEDDDDERQDEQEEAKPLDAKAVDAEEPLVDLMSDQSDCQEQSSHPSRSDMPPISAMTGEETNLLDCSINNLIRLQSETGGAADELVDISSLEDPTGSGNSDEQQPMDTTTTSDPITDPSMDDHGGATPAEQLSAIKCRNDELAAQLETAQASIVSLERRLGSSYVSYGQLEMSYSRLQAELAKLDVSHKSDLARLQVRIEELTRDLAASERRLEEASDKLHHLEASNNSKPDQSELGQAKPDELAPKEEQTIIGRTGAQTKPPNWLRGSPNQQPHQQQQVSHSHSNLHHHQPLLLMHHVKHTLVANQQTLGLKLLNHSKQIQRKLNELELKVDKIHSTNIKEASLVNI